MNYEQRLQQHAEDLAKRSHPLWANYKEERRQDLRVTVYYKLAAYVLEQQAESFLSGYKLAYERENPDSDFIGVVYHDFEKDISITKTPEEYYKELLASNGYTHS